MGTCSSSGPLGDDRLVVSRYVAEGPVSQNSGNGTKVVLSGSTDHDVEAFKKSIQIGGSFMCHRFCRKCATKFNDRLEVVIVKDILPVSLSWYHYCEICKTSFLHKDMGCEQPVEIIQDKPPLPTNQSIPASNLQVSGEAKAKILRERRGKGTESRSISPEHKPIPSSKLMVGLETDIIKQSDTISPVPRSSPVEKNRYPSKDSVYEPVSRPQSSQSINPPIFSRGISGEVSHHRNISTSLPGVNMIKGITPKSSQLFPAPDPPT